MRLIDADALMKTLGITDMDCGRCDLHGAMGCSKKGGFVDACVAIEHAPIIEERKKGKWVYHDDDDMRFDTYHCSSCRKLFTVDAERFDDIGFVKEDLKYCPNCGADMRGENDGE